MPKKNAKSKRMDAERACECGCGECVSIAKTTDKRRGHVRGEPVRFIAGHNSRGKNNPNWNGGIKIDKRDGRVYIYNPKYPRSDCKGYVRRSILIVEKITGKSLPLTSEIHHYNGNPGDDNNGNLVVCENHAYHMFLHLRKRAKEKSGNKNYRVCVRCGCWDDPENLIILETKRSFWSYHNKCNTDHQRNIRRKKRAEKEC